MRNLKTFENFENSDFKEFDTVISIEQIKDIPIGTKGKIVHLHKSNNYEIMYYEVEFFDDDHNTISVETVTKKQIEKI
jgi:hypothetical protein